ncbi:alcohol acetyltransferase [Limtongia smithiae]|uniref:alcohol acetyltransferase n=1 Tax=Limtongia smithiae TaxID=1125753 RepID=UPI0034CE4067
MEAARVVSRPLSHVEQFYMALGKLNFYQAVLVWIDFDLPVDKDGLYAAVLDVMSKNPALCVHVQNSHTSVPTLELLKEINLDDIVEFQTNDGEFDSFLTSALTFCFDYNESNVPLWKLIVVNQTKIVLLFDHMVIDGTAAMLTLTSIAWGMKSQANDTPATSIMTTNETMSVQPAIEQLANVGPSLRFMVGLVYEGLRSKIPILNWYPKRDAKLFGTVRSPASNAFVKIRVVSKERANALLKACRAHDTTLTPLLSVLLFAAMSVTYPQADGFKLCVPINARRFMDEANQADNLMGSYVFQVDRVFPSLAKTEFSWTVVASFGKTLKDGTNLSAGNPLGALKYLDGKYESWLSSQIGQDRTEDLELSNIGAVSCPEWVTGVGFAQPLGVMQAALQMTVVGVLGGGVTITMTGADAVLGEGKGEMIWDAFLRSLDGVAE